MSTKEIRKFQLFKAIMSCDVSYIFLSLWYHLPQGLHQSQVDDCIVPLKLQDEELNKVFFFKKKITTQIYFVTVLRNKLMQHTILNVNYKYFTYILYLYKCISCPIMKIKRQSSAFLIIGEVTLMHCHHSKFVVYITVLSTVHSIWTNV